MLTIINHRLTVRRISRYCPEIMAVINSQNHEKKNFIYILALLLLYFPLISSTMVVLNSSLGNYEINSVVPTTPLLNFLQTVQKTALLTLGEKNFDPKLYVDLSLKVDLSKTKLGFDKIHRNANGSVSVKDLNGFIQDYFEGAGDDLVVAYPPDFVAEPNGFLPAVQNPTVRAWALEIHSLWKNLSRKVDSQVHEKPDFHTLLPLPDSVIVPGSRFREVYYWDSYWVIRGLMASKMYDSAKAIVYNLISLVDTYGYVLNGARAYYTNRSQPPLLSGMIVEIYNRTGDVAFAKTSLPALLKEYQFWNSDIHKVVIKDPRTGINHTLNRYYARWNKPRPESSTTDEHSASKFSNDVEKQEFYRELASAAESGWDFSTRWMRNHSDFTTMSTTLVLPVDLNVFVLKMELDIALLAKAIGDSKNADSFTKASIARKLAIDSIFWKEEMGQWLDYWLDNSTCQEAQTWKASNQNQNIFASNFAPLWIGLFSSDSSLVAKTMKSLNSSGLVCPAGIATSLTRSGQQWDFPNGWAPLQHIIVEGLARSEMQEAIKMAQDIAISWIRTNYATYVETGEMHEKYDVEKCGKSGGGGEYIPQTGFGWSNGVILAFFEEFGWPKDLPMDCQGDTPPTREF